jgi:RNA dependent RNA polymerase
MFHNKDNAVIRGDMWAAAKSKMEREATKETKKKKKKQKKTPGQALYHFCYSLQDRKFVSYDVERVSNLFLVYMTAMGENVSQDYLVVQMNDEDVDDEPAGQERRKKPQQQQANKRSSFSYDVDPLREEILRQGIKVVSGYGPESVSYTYHLLGCSNSQIQKHRYIFRRATTLQENESRMIKILPHLRELKVPKQVKYAGLLFSGITLVKLPTDEPIYTEEIASVQRNDYDFTDGPGLISKKLALKVAQQLGLQAMNCPSIFQIRYCAKIRQLENQGGAIDYFVCKGVLVVDPTNDETYKIQLRKSMLKIRTTSQVCDVLHNFLGICDYSRPSPGRLGQQQICLLSGTVEPSDFLQLQQEHLERVQNAMHDPFAMAWVSALGRNHQVWKNFHRLIMAELLGTTAHHGGKWNGQTSPPAYDRCIQMLGKEGAFRKANKVQLPIAASRTLFGAVIPELLNDFVQEGECVVLLESGPLSSSGRDENYVIVSRSPSYHPGDIRVIRVWSPCLMDTQFSS